ncbi:hypothetical protein E4U41_001505 [Claviceps citrina]|nr:hypothetical protein E4U41_001505 [Claviceps citrina]
MDDASSSLSFLTTTLVHIIKSAWSFPWARYAALLASGVVFPLYVLWTPVSYLVRVLQAVFAPVRYVLDYAGGWVDCLVGFLISLEPLYTFFSIAAFIGLLAGILTALASAVVTTLLNMHDDPADVQAAFQLKKRLQNQSLKEQYLQDQYLSGGDRPPQKRQQQQQQHLGIEPDWHWADPAALALSPKGTRFRRISSVQAETIHEEEDDDDSE